MRPQVWRLTEDCVIIYKKEDAYLWKKRLCFVLNRRSNPKGRKYEASLIKGVFYAIIR